MVNETVQEYSSSTPGGQQVTVRYWTYGNPQAPAMVLLHGFRGNHRGLILLAQLLLHYRVIVPDLPGWGESDPLTVRHDFSNYSIWLREFISTVASNGVVLAGHSYGAVMAMLYAAKHHDGLRQLILIEPVLGDRTISNRLGQLYYQIADRLPPAIQNAWIKNTVLNRLTTEIMTVTKNRETKRRIVADEQANVPQIRTPVELEAFHSFYETTFDSIAQKISTPTLVIAGDRDQMTPLSATQKFTEKLPHGKLVVLPGAGHFAPMEIPSAIAQAIETTSV